MTSNTLGIGGVHRCGTWASIGNGIVDFHQCGAWPASASVRHRRRPSMRHVGQHRIINESGARQTLSSAGTACTILTKQISTLAAGTSAAHPGRRRGGCTGRRGRQGPHPRARKIEVTRARYPLPEPRRTSPPLTLLRAGARGPPWLTAAARNARAHAGQDWSARRVPTRARAQCRDHPRPLFVPGAAPHFITVHTRPRRRQGVAKAHGRRAQRAGTCRAALERQSLSLG